MRAFARGMGAALVVFAATKPLCAQGAGDDAERIRVAATEYDGGRRAYVAGDFEGAAAHFENAWHDAPRAESLRSAIRARRAAKQAGRAATLAALAQARYPADPQTLALAAETLADLRAGLHETRVRCSPACALTVDGRVSPEPVVDVRLYLEPGRHELSAGWSLGRVRHIVVEAVAGGSESEVLEVPAVSPIIAAPIGPVSNVVVRGRRPFGPIVFVVGAALTAAGVGATIGSGIDTLERPGTHAVRQRCVGLGEGCPEYQQGRDAQLRTNILLAATGGLALATGVVGLFFTRWRVTPVVPVGAAAGGVVVDGAF